MSIEKHTPLPWKVRKHPELGCFIEAKIPGKPYGQEIMGDDYFPHLSREADAEFIVKCVSAAGEMRAAMQFARNVVTARDGPTKQELAEVATRLTAAMALTE